MGRIFDAVYGYIELDSVEFALVNSPIFQRLHWIKQLGPLNTIFPSAQHSRFSHSIGVCHIVKKMIKYLREREGPYQYQFNSDDKRRALSLAALLHDIGHLPLSHIGERVLEKVVRSDSTETTIDIYDKENKPRWEVLFPDRYIGDSTKLHEALSAEIVLHDEEIDRILREDNEGWSDDTQRRKVKEMIARIIVGKDSSDVATLLLHSELDADRLDYLLRDSFFTGVDYGKIDLDYIISRLGVVKKADDMVQYLCVEQKGLHTVEHYILGRFFLQTQVIYNRKVRLMDLLCEDVMEYMVRDGSEDWGLMNLRDLIKHIRHEDGDLRDHLHEIYAYTDAQVFVKMRKLHDELDKKEKSEAANSPELYMNSCVKMIMNGKIPDPVVAHQRLVNLATKSGENFERVVGDEADRIAGEIAHKLEIYRKQIKENIIVREAMKYKPRMRRDKEANREAVKITYRSAVGEDEIVYAAESNASILSMLGDRALAILNVYYIPSKGEEKTAISEKEDAIKKAYGELVKQYFQAKMEGCGCTSGRHMCQIVQETNGLKEVRKLSKGARYICQECGRVSSRKKYLCEGTAI